MLSRKLLNTGRSESQATAWRLSRPWARLAPCSRPTSPQMRLSCSSVAVSISTTVLGPFYRENPPVLPKGGSTIQKHFDNEETAYFEGYIKDENGNGIAGVTLDVWEDAPNGVYENLDPDQPEYNLRGRFETDENGHYAFVAVRPVPYPIPDDETAGELLRFMGHHPNRPGHMHFIISKDGYRPLISQIYDADSAWLEEDSVFAVKESLIGKFKPAAADLGTDLHFEFDFVLKTAANGKATAAE